MFQQAKQVKPKMDSAIAAIYNPTTKQTLYVKEVPERLGFLWQFTEDRSEACLLNYSAQADFLYYMQHDSKLVEFQYV